MTDFAQELAVLAQALADARAYLDVDGKRARVAELQQQASAPDLWNDADEARALLSQLARLEDDVKLYEELATQLDDAKTLHDLARAEDDRSYDDEIANAIVDLKKRVEELEVRTLLGGEHDERDAIVTIHAGAGGTEAQDWADMLLRMYLRWSERRGFTLEVIERQEGEEAGIKSATFIAHGRFAYGLFSAEHGVHRLVRISPFDANKRRHTSFAAVDVVPVLEDEDTDIEIPEKDLKVDVYRSSGPGGQSVNTTDSAVRITHLPTGIVVTSQNERSQLQNKQVCMRVLKARLAELMRQERAQKLEELRGERKGIEWGSQIRSYVLDDRRVKDVRTGEETSNTEAVLD
ncbi:MAG: peptide chain release factor 2, partial [Actinobacteria bacterium]|nr:peptide chain release factor 2 [Actinomycetota bacterium]